MAPILYLCSMKCYVDVIVPLPIAGQYTYSLPDEMVGRVLVGCRVVVPFGRKKYYTGLVTRIHEDAPEGYETKEVAELLDEHPILFERQYRFWKWLSEYYLCTLGDVYKAALPSGMKLESETLVVYNPEFVATGPLPEKEQRILDVLSLDTEQCITQLEKNSGIRQLLPVIQSLLEKGAICVKEELKRSYKPKVETRIRLTEGMRSEEMLRKQLDLLARAPKQLAVLMKYLELSAWSAPGNLPKEVTRKQLLETAGVSAAVVNGLVEKRVLETYTAEVGRLIREDRDLQALHTLSEAQEVAFRQILTTFHTKNVCLLHGVTASGKTEIYIHLIQQVLSVGKQVLYLLPEIALTTQITERLKRVFGDKLGIYHSKFPDAERVEIWRKQLSEHDYDVILGVRSSVFLPFRRLGLVTPSIETYYNALQGKYGLVELTERHRQICLPRIEVVDIKELARKKRMTGPFSPMLLQQMREALERKEQVILFQNRRGFAPMIECHTCGWVPRCKNCDVSLTYHKGLNQLTCHYCGYTYQVPRSCPACGGVELKDRGFGTEKVEDDVKRIFPEVRVARMDLDTTRTRTAYETIIADFQAGRTDVLIGTQMVSKGLDFDRVSVVGILNADSLLNYPDFRSYERAFQLMAQVAGRAGRKNRQGLVILQTKSPDLPLIHQVVTNDYRQMYTEQLEERRLFNYPPFDRLVYVYLKHRKEEVVDQAASVLAGWLRSGMGEWILGPDKPPVGRIQQLFIKKIVVKIAQGTSMTKVRSYLLQLQHALVEDERFRSLVVYYDVDPM